MNLRKGIVLANEEGPSVSSRIYQEPLFQLNSNWDTIGFVILTAGRCDCCGRNHWLDSVASIRTLVVFDGGAMIVRRC